jgi:hypothetical protein
LERLISEEEKMLSENTEIAGREQAHVEELMRRLDRQFRSGADWFFWIVGLSVINSLIGVFGGRWSFLVGLGVTRVVDGFARALATGLDADLGMAVRTLGLVIDIGLAGVFALFGVFARRGKRWSFIIGMILYALDGLIFLIAPDFVSIGFHVFALFWISIGLKAKTKLGEIERGEDDGRALADRVLSPKEPRSRSYWVKLGLVAAILLVPLVIFLVMFLLFMK